jgi:hypothetical protein
MVRLGLMLIALTLGPELVVSLFTALILGVQGLGCCGFLWQAFPITGYLMCALVPLKGAPRNLALANLGIIAIGLTLTIIALRMVERQDVDADELIRKQTAAENDAIAEQQELKQQRKDLSKKLDLAKKRATQVEGVPKQDPAEANKLAAAVAEATRQVEEVDQKLAVVGQRIAAQREEARNSLARPISKVAGFWGWIDASALWFLLQWCIQIVLLTFFIRAIAQSLRKRIESTASMESFLEKMVFGWNVGSSMSADHASVGSLLNRLPLGPGRWLIQRIARALGERDLVTACPRVALAALLTVSLVFLAVLALPEVWQLEKGLGWWTFFVLIWGIQALGLITFVWLELILIETYFLIGKHLPPESV